MACDISVRIVRLLMNQATKSDYRRRNGTLKPLTFGRSRDT
jgi:hypothetical protein